MSKREQYEARTEALITPILDALRFELVDVEYGKEDGEMILRAYIDKEGGITVDDCAEVSRRMDALLDAEDFIDGSYIFEVSSPGLDRPLKKEKDFARSVGKEVEVKTYRAVDGKKEFRGTLTAYTEETVTIQIGENEEQLLARKDIARIRLAFDF